MYTQSNLSKGARSARSRAALTCPVVYATSLPLPSHRLKDLAINTGVAALRTPYLRAVGLTVEKAGRGRATADFSADDELQFKVKRGEKAGE